MIRRVYRLFRMVCILYAEVDSSMEDAVLETKVRCSSLSVTE